MRRRPLALVLTAALIGAVFTALPAKAAPEIPATANIEDPAGDANYYSFTEAGAPNTVSMGAGDLHKVWFTNDATSISVHWLTADNPQPESLNFVATVDAGAGACLQLVGVSAGNANDAYAAIDDRDCSDSGAFATVGEFVEEPGGDGQVIHTSTFSRDAYPAFTDGQVLKAPSAFVRHHIQTPAGSSFATLIDTTGTGTDYTIAGSSEGPPVVEEPEEPKPAKNPCKKLKGKKKKKCLKKHAPKGCATFAPGELGAEAETLVVKDENTAEAPLEITLEHGPGAVRAEVSRSHVIKNLQIDSAASEAGLYIRYEFPDYEDHDLYVEDAAGNVVGQAAGSNQVSDVPEVGPAANEGTGIGGHSEVGAEVIDGLRTADCAGYTVDFDNFAGEGGEYIAKVWLGEPLNDPATPAAKAYVL